MMTIPQRSHQLWSVLIFAAYIRRPLTYSFVGKLLGLPPAALGRYLDPIQYYCQQQGLPPLTILVVQQNTGLPGHGFQGNPADFDIKVWEVFQYDWLSYKAPDRGVGPNDGDFDRAMENHTQS